MRKLKNGINLYNNYYGKVSENVLVNEIDDITIDVEKNVYFNDIDLVFDSENERSQKYKKLQEKENFSKEMDEFIAITHKGYGETFDYAYQSTTEEIYNDEIDEIWKEVTSVGTPNYSKNNFEEEFPTRGLKFISKNSQYPDVEIRENVEISSFLWYNKSRIVFSVNFDGIYTFDCISQKKNRILENTENSIILNSIVDNEITYNNNKKVTLD